LSILPVQLHTRAKNSGSLTQAGRSHLLAHRSRAAHQPARCPRRRARIQGWPHTTTSSLDDLAPACLAVAQSRSYGCPPGRRYLKQQRVRFSSRITSSPHVCQLGRRRPAPHQLRADACLGVPDARSRSPHARSPGRPRVTTAKPGAVPSAYRTGAPSCTLSVFLRRSLPGAWLPLRKQELAQDRPAGLLGRLRKEWRGIAPPVLPVPDTVCHADRPRLRATAVSAAIRYRLPSTCSVAPCSD